MKRNNMLLSAGLPLLMLAGNALAIGCSQHTFGTCADGIVHWYDPDDGQICDPLDCGGGRAPPKTNVPGCPQYKGTEIRQTAPSYMPCFAKPAPSTTSVPPAAAPASTTVSTPTAPGKLTETVATDAEPTDATSPPASPAPSTTDPATLPVPAQEGSATDSTSSSSTSTTATDNSGSVMGGCLLAAAGAAIGAIVLV
ncbi:hypothetical protein QBC44DRAFT_134786 [Cladorrhinum sp. PSN332]|nr:hypothetical protein QBC44DRAFT_134786 [Cladorrhinum sp. PSN332]